ncbi:MAG: protein kinase [Firmicutes bacterium]|nr:protein kinase [Bacillota bacterium]
MKNLDIAAIKRWEPIFGSWYIKDKLSEGSTGCVYAIERNDMSICARSIAKVISIPKDLDEIRILRERNFTDEEIEAYLEAVKDEMLVEISTLMRLKGTGHIVNYEDHIVAKRPNLPGWIIILKMEYLRPISKIIKVNPNFANDLTEIVRMGIDICKALELCSKFNIVHRDIKPENIFRTGFGNYKLGDFGIAWMNDKSVTDINRRGTYEYMAPEVFNCETWDKRVDIYSLGIVLYMMLNNYRTPFLPEYPANFALVDREVAVAKRMNNEIMMPPLNGTRRLKKAVMKACAFNPDDRFGSAEEMREELERVALLLKFRGGV